MEGEGERAREGKEEEVGREDTFKKRSRSKSKSPFFQATRWNVRGRRAARVFFPPPLLLQVFMSIFVIDLFVSCTRVDS